ncbi:restriction endonuclease subunit S [Lunatibacter salilacus]|uniref:restriction endonuclease subunit S n=1 Tax=Lunatibacter salilacus TaxID=2483804 RepID=UPI00131B4B98|nr:restriction endonuclease subunit S [Lunatibacter salilacus]
MELVAIQYKHTEIGLIPEDWRIESILDVADVKRGKFTPRPRNNPFYYGGNIPFVQTGDVTRCGGVVRNYSQTLNQQGLAVSKLFKKGTVLMTIAANIGYTGVLEIDMACPDSLIGITGLKADNHYLNYYFIYHREDIEDLSTSGAQKNLNIELFSKFKIALPPSKKEQQAIAQVLSDTDRLIQSLEKKIAKKKLIKQGVMQDLLTPKLGWKSLNLGKCATLKARIGWQGLTTAEYLHQGPYHLVTGTDFKGGFIDWDNCVFVEEFRYIQDTNIQLKINDVLVTKDGTIGKIALIDSLTKPATLNSGVFVIRPIQKSFDSRYLYYILRSSHFAEFLARLTAGSTINHLYQKDFVHFDFPIPPSTEEQTAIANILSSMDAELRHLEIKLSRFKQVKQGMMQQLLTGKIRLV